MHILMMISSIAMGGTERTMLSVLPVLNETEHDVTILTLNTRRDSALIEIFEKTGVERIDLGAQRMIDPAAWRRFTEILKSGKYDIIHPQDQDTIIYGALAHRRLGIPSVMSRHVMDEPQSTWKQYLRARLLLFAARYGFNRVITVSDAVRQHFHKISGIPLDRIETVYNGLDLELFNTQSKREQTRTALGWSSDEQIIIMVAVLRPGKGHEILFEAIPQITSQFPKARIKLVGGGELEADLRKQAQPYSDVIEFVGQRSDVPDLLGASDILVLPSWSEALPTVLIEAGAAGLPVVATDVGGTKEIVKHGETGYVVPPGNATELATHLSKLLGDNEQSTAMGKAAQIYIRENFSLQRQAEALINLYKGVLDQS